MDGQSKRIHSSNGKIIGPRAKLAHAGNCNQSDRRVRARIRGARVGVPAEPLTTKAAPSVLIVQQPLPAHCVVRPPRGRMAAKIFGWAIYAVGFVIWLFGYLTAGHVPLFDWNAITPWWISSFVPNVEAEIGFALM